MKNNKKKTSFRFLSIIMRAILSCALVAALLYLADTSEIVTIVARIHPLPFLGACLMFSIGQLLSAVRWRLIIQSGGTAGVGTWYLNGLLHIGMCFNFFLPSTIGGDVVRAELTSPRLGGRVAAYGGILFDRFVAFLSVVALGILALALMFITAGWFDISLIAICAFFLAIAISALVVIRWPVIEWIVRFLPTGWLRRLFAKINKLLILLRRYLADKKLFAKTFALSFIIQIVGVNIVVYFLAISLNIEVPPLYHFVAVPIITLVTLAPISFNGLGVREIAFALLYAKVGVGTEAAVALSLAFTVVLVIFAAVGGVCIQIPALYQRRAVPQGHDK